MWAGGAAGGPDLRDHVAFPHGHARFDEGSAEVEGRTAKLDGKPATSATIQLAEFAMGDPADADLGVVADLFWRRPDATRNDHPAAFAAIGAAAAFGEVAEAENHHPNVSFTWGRVEVEIWTHKIDGLTESDFILAAKIDAIRKEDG